MSTLADPLAGLRELRHDAPWNLRDLAATTAAILEEAGVRPLNAAAADAPSERTIRYYVARGLVTPPEGRGPAAVYAYRHLLEVLAVKLRQMDGATLDRIARELRDTTGDVLERRVAATLGPTLPAVARIRVAGSGRAFHARMRAASAGGERSPPDAWRRLPIGPGLELHLAIDHPLARDGRAAELAERVRDAASGLTRQSPVR